MNMYNISYNIIALPCGVYSDEKQLRFAGGDKINSMISNNGNSFIQCIALDHVLPGFKPTFISMDVEGVELEALKGSEGLLKKSKPDLAVCVYHTPNHIWDIPLYLDSLNLGYKFILGIIHHSLVRQCYMQQSNVNMICRYFRVGKHQKNRYKGVL